LPPSRLYFADLHFHTCFSDNRDFASAEQMIQAGRKHSLSIFGVGDHNHNLDAGKWRELKRQTACLRRKYPSLLLLDNCEITFLMGHFLVVDPRRITGTIEEGYAYLYGTPDAVKIVCHPDPETDEWQKRLVPTAAGIEVVNGAVFRKAWEGGWRAASALDVPLVRTYAQYLGCGRAVAAIGSSDAHTLSEMGSGMTGVWMESALGKEGLLAAIRALRTFATTDPGIRLECHLEEASGELRWEVRWEPLDPGTGRDFRVELFRGEQKLEAAAPQGRLPVAQEGLYWLAALNERALAVSSPVFARARRTLPAALLRESLRDLVWRELRRGRSLGQDRASQRGSRELELLSWDPEPPITDAAGRAVPATFTTGAAERLIIDKSCGSPCFAEYYLWLRRNEIHEYTFVEIRYEKQGDVLQFDGRVAPAKMILSRRWRGRYRAESRRLRRLIGPGTGFRLSVRTLLASTVRLELREARFPLQVGEVRNGLRSLLVCSAQRPDEGALRRLLGSEAIPAELGKPEEAIYQVFVACS
jgi:hypothetical protein